MTVQRRIPGQLTAVECLCDELNLQINPDLRQHRAGRAALSAAALRPTQMIEEITVQPCISAYLCRNTDLIQLQRDQTHIHLQPQSRADADRTDHIEIKIVIRLDDIDRLVGRRLRFYADRENISLLHGVIKFHTDRSGEIRRYHKASLHLPAEDM